MSGRKVSLIRLGLQLSNCSRACVACKDLLTYRQLVPVPTREESRCLYPSMCSRVVAGKMLADMGLVVR